MTLAETFLPSARFLHGKETGQNFWPKQFTISHFYAWQTTSLLHALTMWCLVWYNALTRCVKSPFAIAWLIHVVEDSPFNNKQNHYDKEVAACVVTIHYFSSHQTTKKKFQYCYSKGSVSDFSNSLQNDKKCGLFGIQSICRQQFRSNSNGGTCLW